MPIASIVTNTFIVKVTTRPCTAVEIPTKQDAQLKLSGEKKILFRIYVYIINQTTFI